MLWLTAGLWLKVVFFTKAIDSREGGGSGSLFHKCPRVEFVRKRQKHYLQLVFLMVKTLRDNFWGNTSYTVNLQHNRIIAKKGIWLNIQGRTCWRKKKIPPGIRRLVVLSMPLKYKNRSLSSPVLFMLLNSTQLLP